MSAGERLQHAGAAPATSLNGAINSSTSSIVVIDATGYPDGSVGPFWIVVDPSLAAEEKIKCVSRTGNTITAVTTPATGRGGDNTSATSHVSGAVVQHILSANELDLLNQHINDQNDNHVTYLTTGRHDTAARHALGTSIGAGTPGTSAPADVPAQGVSTNGARADHTHGREDWGGIPGSLSAGSAGNGGSDTRVARGDHSHTAATASSASVGTANSAGASGNFADAVHVHAAPQHVRLLGRDNSLNGGTPPAAATGPWLMQCGTTVITLAGSVPEAEATVNLPTSFPNGIVTVLISNGDATVGADYTVSTKVPTGTSSFIAHVRSSAGNNPNGSNFRVNWVCYGW